MDKYNCVEELLSWIYGKFGRIVGKYPLVFLISPLVITACLCSGYFLEEDPKPISIEDQFTPKNGPAKAEREFVKDHFQQSEEFSSLRLYTDGTYASIIAMRSTNILTQEALQDILDLDGEVKELQTDGDNLTFSDLCAKKNGECVSNTILDIMNSSIHNGEAISYPFHNINIFNREFIGRSIGGVNQYPDNNSIETANAIRLFYYLEDNRRNETGPWLKKFISSFTENKSPENLSIAYFTSISREEEFDTNLETDIALFVTAYILVYLIMLVIIICYWRQDCVRNKAWLFIFGMVSVFLALLSSYGLVLLCGMPFVMALTTAPFLTLEVGVDEISIMKSCWQKTKVCNSVRDRMEETYQKAAVSITITIVTDFLAFYISLMTPFESVQYFCMFTGIALLFCFIYNITFFGAIMALNGHREEENRHCLTCKIVKKANENREGNACSVGGAYDHKTDREKETCIDKFVKKYYGPFLTNTWTKVFVVLLYTGYLAGSIYGCFQMQLGLDLRNLAPDESYVASYYDNEERYFSEYGPVIMLIIRNESFQYWERSAKDSLSMCLKEFETSDMVAKNMTISWLESFETFGDYHRFKSVNESVFMENFTQFLSRSGSNQDVNITDGKIRASRFFIPTVNISANDKKDLLNFFRNTALNCTENINASVYHPDFIYLDQHTVMLSNTIANVVAITAVLIVFFLLVPNLRCSLCMTLATVSLIVGVTGFMALWGVHLDSISMANYAICICVSVDFSAHISYAFASSEEKTVTDKTIDAIYRFGQQIVEAAVLNIASALCIAVNSYVFRTFFKIMFLAIMFGALHGIVFIPVFLTFFGCCSDKKGNSHTNLHLNDLSSIGEVNKANSHTTPQFSGAYLHGNVCDT